MSGELSSYHDLIARKRIAFEGSGFADADEGNMPSWMFPHQAHGTAFALRAGRSALFYDTGLGKTGMALAWGDEVVRRTNRPVLMLAPLAVGTQHAQEADRFGIATKVARFGGTPSSACIAITNYERLEKFDPADFAGVILDESSILKSFTGATTRKLIDAFARTPYRLATTATPAPNDHAELGTHSEFLGVLSQSQMLLRWFIHDSADTGTWRMKGHAVKDFWSWVASWSRAVARPSDIGFSDDGFTLPPLNIVRHVVQSDRTVDRGEEKDGQGLLFRMPSNSATSVHQEKKLTKAARAGKVAELVAAEPGEPWIIWVDTDYDEEAVKDAIPGAVAINGKMSADVKEDLLMGFTEGRIRVLVTKPSIAGFGLNWQHCARVAFCGISFSYEKFYQAVRRCYRFRQTRQVDVHIVGADTEAAIESIVARKAGDHDAMKREMVEAMRRASISAEQLRTYAPTKEARLPAWLINASA